MNQRNPSIRHLKKYSFFVFAPTDFGGRESSPKVNNWRISLVSSSVG
jgi:hypothetical protein